MGLYDRARKKSGSGHSLLKRANYYRKSKGYIENTEVNKTSSKKPKGPGGHSLLARAKSLLKSGKKSTGSKKYKPKNRSFLSKAKELLKSPVRKSKSTASLIKKADQMSNNEENIDSFDEEVSSSKPKKSLSEKLAELKEKTEEKLTEEDLNESKSSDWASDKSSNIESESEKDETLDSKDISDDSEKIIPEESILPEAEKIDKTLEESEQQDLAFSDDSTPDASKQNDIISSSDITLPQSVSESDHEEALSETKKLEEDLKSKSEDKKESTPTLPESSSPEETLSSQTIPQKPSEEDIKPLLPSSSERKESPSNFASSDLRKALGEQPKANAPQIPQANYPSGIHDLQTPSPSPPIVSKPSLESTLPPTPASDFSPISESKPQALKDQEPSTSSQRPEKITEPNFSPSVPVEDFKADMEKTQTQETLPTTPNLSTSPATLESPDQSVGLTDDKRPLSDSTQREQKKIPDDEEKKLIDDQKPTTQGTSDHNIDQSTSHQKESKAPTQKDKNPEPKLQEIPDDYEESTKGFSDQDSFSEPTYDDSSIPPSLTPNDFENIEKNRDERYLRKKRKKPKKDFMGNPYITHRAHEIVDSHSPYSHHYNSLLNAERFAAENEPISAIEIYQRILNKIPNQKIQGQIKENISDLSDYLESGQPSHGKPSRPIGEDSLQEFSGKIEKGLFDIKNAIIQGLPGSQSTSENTAAAPPAAPLSTPSSDTPATPQASGTPMQPASPMASQSEISSGIPQPGETSATSPDPYYPPPPASSMPQEIKGVLELKPPEPEDQPFLTLTYDFTRIPHKNPLSKNHSILEYAYYKYKPMLIKAQRFIQKKQITRALNYYRVIKDQQIPDELRIMIDKNISDITDYMNKFLTYEGDNAIHA